MWRNISEKSILYNVFRIIYGHFLASYVLGINHEHRGFSNLDWTSIPLQNSYDALLADNLDAYARRINILAERTRMISAVPVFVTQPSRHYRIRDGRLEGVNIEKSYKNSFLNGVDSYYVYKLFNDVTMSVCKKQRAICIDLAYEVKWEDDDFYDFIHMTPKGVKKIGEYIFANLRDIYKR